MEESKLEKETAKETVSKNFIEQIIFISAMPNQSY